MSKYVYTAILEPEDGKFNVTFPALEDCFTCGDDLYDAIKMARDALTNYLIRQEKFNRPIPKAADPLSVKVTDDRIATLIDVNTDERRKHEKDN